MIRTLPQALHDAGARELRQPGGRIDVAGLRRHRPSVLGILLEELHGQRCGPQAGRYQGMEYPKARCRNQKPRYGDVS